MPLPSESPLPSPVGYTFGAGDLRLLLALPSNVWLQESDISFLVPSKMKGPSSTGIPWVKAGGHSVLLCGGSSGSFEMCLYSFLPELPPEPFNPRHSPG